METKQKTVMVFGTFDIVHLGHIAFFKEAKRYGTNLVVVVARDNRAREVKGTTPLFSERERAIFLKEFSLIDRIVLGHPTDMYRRIREIKPDVIVLGYDQQAFTEKLEQKIQEFGLKTIVKRAKPYKSKKYKTTILKQNLLKYV